MTDRLAGFVVTLEQDLRDDDAQATIAAIRQIKGVISVEPVLGGPDIHIAEERARLNITTRLYDALRKK